MKVPSIATESIPRGSSTRLTLLFGAIYFVQGVAEPGEGLIAQPVRSMLRSWGRTPEQITEFAALAAIPWSLKPIFGLIKDLVPIFGSRRRNYLIVSTAAATLGLWSAFALLSGRPSIVALLGWMLLPTAAIAFADVVTDALMVETGKPLGLCGVFQSVQWACLYAATIACGLVGGWLSEHGHQRYAFAIASVLSAGMLVLVILFVRDVPGERPSRRLAWRSLGDAVRNRQLRSAAAFLFLWNVNPFSQTVLHQHMIGALHLGEQFYGQTVAILAGASLLASLGYGALCRAVPIRSLVGWSVWLGVASTLAYWGLSGRTSAVIVAAVVGVTYITATLIQLDLAARSCPSEIAGTAFAILMALENTATAASVWLGGKFYAWGSKQWGEIASFNVLVAIGALTTAACFLIIPKHTVDDGR